MAFLFGAVLAGHAGEVQFSNGEIVTGKISITPGIRLKVHVENLLRDVDFNQVVEIRVEPEKEEMARNWRHVEAGRTEKELWGEPFPVRHLRSKVVLSDGTIIEGHLYTTVLYLEGEQNTQKVILRAKLSGKQGETMEDLLYPVRIVTDNRGTGSASQTLENGVVLAGPGLVRMTGALPAHAEPAFLATREGDEIVVNWPGHAGGELLQALQAGLAQTRDFFEQKDLLEAWADGEDIYCLLMLRRVNKTSLGNARSLPWRLGVWRWKRSEEGRLMLAGQGYFYRGILAANENPPRVRIVVGVKPQPAEDDIVQDE